MENKPIIIGVSGFARSGKDTFVKIAKKILKENGYTTQQKAFANELKNDIDDWLKEKYGISAWTDDAEEKKIIRPFLVAHGCGKRFQTKGKCWIDKVDEKIKFEMGVYGHAYINHLKHVIFISDVRFPNEADWIHNDWNGWLVHLKKYSVITPKGEPIYNEIGQLENPPWKHFDQPPNSEEAENDPICEEKSDYNLEMENAIEREYRLNNIKITPESLIDNTYLNEEIKKCLTQCHLLTLT